MRTCPACKEEKPFCEFFHNKSTSDKTQYKCLGCTYGHNKPHSTRLTPAQTVNKFSGKYEPGEEQVYYRNDGNKHILSKGVRC